MCANLFPRLFVEVFLRVNVTERHTEVRIGVSGASLPARGFLFQAEDFLRELETEIAELLQCQWGNGRVRAPPNVSN